MQKHNKHPNHWNENCVADGSIVLIRKLHFKSISNLLTSNTCVIILYFQVGYCSKECKGADFKKHKEVCKRIACKPKFCGVCKTNRKIFSCKILVVEVVYYIQSTAHISLTFVTLFSFSWTIFNCKADHWVYMALFKVLLTILTRL